MLRIENEVDYFKKIKNFPVVPYVQSKAWCDYVRSQGEEVVFYVDHEKDTLVSFLGRVKKIPFRTQKMLLIDSPLFRMGLSERTIRKRFSELVRDDYAVVEIDSINEYNIEVEIGLRRSGFVRPFGLFKCPLTIIFSLQEPFNFDNNWKKNVSKALNAGVFVKEIKNPTRNDAVCFCSLFEDVKKLKGLKYSLEPESIYKLLGNPLVRLFVAIEHEEIVSAQVIYCYRDYSYSIFRVNSFKSRSKGASYLLYNQILKLLSSEGFLTYDFGRISPSNNASDSVYVFKNASRGKKIQYNGEWVFYRSKFTELLMYFYKQFVLRKQRY